MRKLFIFIFISLWTIGNATAERLSDKAQVSLLTCGKGNELYAQFGHTAIRVSDPALDIDVVYNYGMFNFNTPNFYMKFVKGLTDYQLGIDFTVDFVMRYREREIPVWEQTLNLTQEGKQQIFDALMTNYLPENRFYRYNFIYDNCATRPRDMIEQVFGGQIDYRSEHPETETFRDLIGQYVGKDSWEKFGIDFLIGSPADVVATPRERMFLPIELMNYLQIARQSNGTAVVTEKTTVVDLPEKETDTPYLSPLLVSFLFMIVVFLLSFFFSSRRLLWLDMLLFSAAGILGVILFYLANFSLHPLVSPNYNLLWIQPLHLLFVLLLPFRRLYKILVWYQILNALAILLALSGFLFLPQKFNLAFLPLMLAILIRAIQFIRLQELFTHLQDEKDLNN
ncbi:MAG: DUF4105 domain-containing protein [Prevotellaceae bacterium]|jgi:hypothetical protein|nr:DUF4105 domain-containing protein [Prevotellaceae bacterium]